METEMKTRYELSQGGISLGQRSFADTKAFALKTAPYSARPKIRKATRLASLLKAIGNWAEVRPVKG
jgi:hypothetical protein